MSAEQLRSKMRPQCSILSFHALCGIGNIGLRLVAESQQEIYHFFDNGCFFLGFGTSYAAFGATYQCCEMIADQGRRIDHGDIRDIFVVLYRVHQLSTVALRLQQWSIMLRRQLDRLAPSIGNAFISNGIGRLRWHTEGVFVDRRRDIVRAAPGATKFPLLRPDSDDDEERQKSD